MGAGHFPAVVLSANEVKRGHANILKEDGVVVSAHERGLRAAVTQQIQRLDGDAGKIGWHYYPAQILMPRPPRVTKDYCPVLVHRTVGPDKGLCAVQNVLVAI